MMAELTYCRLGPVAYQPALALQCALVDRVRVRPERRYLLVLEHNPPVITFGRTADETNLLVSRERLAREGIELHAISRGGDVTYHGPGQLVGYPIFHLDPRGRDVRRFLRDLEEVLIRALNRFGIAGTRAEGLTGVWVGGEKIAAIGVAVSRWVTYHGFALNVCPNLSHFDLIVPCGLTGKRVTSLAKILGREVAVNEAIPAVVEEMGSFFGLDSLYEVSRADLEAGA